MDWQAYRESLGELIERELALTHELGEALAAERDALRHVDPAALDQATTRKQGCVEELGSLDVERRDLCAATGLAPDRNGMEQLLKLADPTGHLASRWQSLLTRLESCREANHNNGAVVRLQKRRVTEALGILQGSAGNCPVYGATGEIDENGGHHVHAEI